MDLRSFYVASQPVPHFLMSVEESDADDNPTRAYSLFNANQIAANRGWGKGPNGMRQHEISIPMLGTIFFNLITSSVGALALWGFAIWCIEDDEAQTKLRDVQSDVTRIFTWLYIGSQDVWILFVIPVYWYYGSVKLGKDDEIAEFSNSAYFMMIFCAGVAVGLIFYGASEPMYHAIGENRYANNGYYNDNEKMAWGVNLTLFHWGIHGWIVYTTVAMAMGVMHYRHGLPLTFRSTFYPLLGYATWGILGDMLDATSIVTIIAGVCTSLGMGASQIVTGMQRLGWLDMSCSGTVTTNCVDEDDLVMYRCFTIAIITLVATGSVVSGLSVGVKILSQCAFYLGMFLVGVVFFLDDPWYILNIACQSIGFYFQEFLRLGFFCDAWGQLRYGEGKAPDMLGANPSWMDWWTIFYWGWWIAWSPFVGIFLARISRGRTIKELYDYTLPGPFLFAVMWFSCFGGAAQRMHRKAEFLEIAGEKIYGSKNHFVADTKFGTCYVPPASLPCPAGIITNSSLCPAYANEAYATDTRVTPVCLFDTSDADGFWFDLMNQYHGLGKFLSGLSIITMALYFITSSDSGSMVVDLIAANGNEAHVIQRIFWAFTEGSVAIALLVAGKSKALSALQSVSIIAGLPFTAILCAILPSVWLALKADRGHESLKSKWVMPLHGGFIDAIDYAVSFGHSRKPEMAQTWHFLAAFFVPTYYFYVGHPTYVSAQKPLWRNIYVAGATFFFYSWIILRMAYPLDTNDTGLMCFAWMSFFCYVSCGVCLRALLREAYNINGNVLNDVCLVTFLYPQVCAQMFWQSKYPIPEKVAGSIDKTTDENGKNADNEMVPVKLGT